MSVLAEIRKQQAAQLHINSSSSISQPHKLLVTQHTKNRRKTRVFLAGSFYATIIALTVPVSPFFRKSMAMNNNLDVLVGSAFVTSFIGATVFYRLFVDTPRRNRNMVQAHFDKATMKKEKLDQKALANGDTSVSTFTPSYSSSASAVLSSRVPLLNMFSGLLPGLGAAIAGHLCYPGLFIFIGEPYWKARWREYRRLTYKSSVAFFPSHLLYVAIWGCLIVGPGCSKLRQLTASGE